MGEEFSAALTMLTIKGFKSIQKLENFPLKQLNILIGANGTGKSNFISFFQMLNSLIQKNFNNYVTNQGGADDILFNGSKVTENMFFEMYFNNNKHIYKFQLTPTPQENFIISDEKRFYYTSGWWDLGSSKSDIPRLVIEVETDEKQKWYSKPVYNAIQSWQIYHFHDTSNTAKMRRYEIVQDNKKLRKDASNLAPFLFKLKTEHPSEYEEIRNSVRLIAPFFDDFLLEPQKKGEAEKINLSWTQKGSDYPMQPYHLSDGTIRFICLATTLLQPSLPATIIIDEPELGLHPGAIDILAELMQASSKNTQVIVATQSPLLINDFTIDNIIVANHRKGKSTFERLAEKDFKVWLKDYSIGELWTQNIIQGGTCYE